jgi:hypothetical protein
MMECTSLQRQQQLLDRSFRAQRQASRAGWVRAASGERHGTRPLKPAMLPANKGLRRARGHDASARRRVRDIPDPLGRAERAAMRPRRCDGSNPAIAPQTGRSTNCSSGARVR